MILFVEIFALVKHIYIYIYIYMQADPDDNL